MALIKVNGFNVESICTHFFTIFPLTLMKRYCFFLFAFVLIHFYCFSAFSILPLQTASGEVFIQKMIFLTAHRKREEGISRNQQKIKEETINITNIFLYSFAFCIIHKINFRSANFIVRSLIHHNIVNEVHELKRKREKLGHFVRKLHFFSFYKINYRWFNNEILAWIRRQSS